MRESEFVALWRSQSVFFSGKKFGDSLPLKGGHESMPVIKDEEIAGYYVGEDVVCRECFDGKKDEITGVLSRDEQANFDGVYLCDRCDKEL